MAFDNFYVDLTFTASGDLSAGQYKFVKLTGTGDQVAICNGATDIPVGILQSKPTAAGQAATVRVLGVSKVQADASLTVGTLIGTSGDGQADAKAVTDTTEYVVGAVIGAAGAAGEIATVLINCLNPTRAN